MELGAASARPLLLLAAVALMAAPPTLHAQGVEESLASLARENAEGYIGPLTTGLSHAMTGGVFDSARPLGRFGFDVGLRISAALPPAEADQFNVVLPASVTWRPNPQLPEESHPNPYRIKGGGSTSPTVVGDGSGAVLEPTGTFLVALLAAGENPANHEIDLPDGLKVPAIPYATLTASLGLGFGTDLSLRFIPEVEVQEEIGGISATGFALRHSLSQWFPSPMDLAAVFGSQKVTVGNYLEASSTQFGVIASQGFGPLTLFGTGTMRSGKVEVDYTTENPDNTPGLPADGTRFTLTHDLESGTSFGAGARLQLLFLNLSAQYTFDDYPVASLTVGLGLP